MTAVADLPAGTVAFLFTDLEGSTRLLQAHPHAYRELVARHHALLQEAVEAHGGAVIETEGDAVSAAFERPTDAVAAALAGQVALCQEAWGAPGPLRARMGLHSGEAEVREAELALGQACLARFGTLRPGGPSPVLHTYPDAEGRVDLRWLRLRDAT